MRGEHGAGPGPLRLALILAGTGLMLAPAVWNGYPLLFFDTADYIAVAFGEDLPVYRTAAYPLFLAPARWTGTLWTPVVIQAVMIATLLVLAAERLLGRGWGAGRGIALLAAAGIGLLPIYAAQAMADGFTLPLLLAAVALMLPAVQGETAEGEAQARIAGLVLILLLAVAAALHTSHLGLLAGLLILGAMIVAVGRWWPSLPRPRLGGLALALGLGIALAAGANHAATGRIFVSQPAVVQTLALFVQNGLAARYLDDICPTDPDPPALCPYRDRLPETANEFLWANAVWGDSPFRALGGFTGLEGEAGRIVRGVAARYPMALARESLAYAGWQFTMVGPGDGLFDMGPWIGPLIDRHLPADTAAFTAAPQQADRLRVLKAKPVHGVVRIAFLAAVAAMAGLALAWAMGEGEVRRRALVLALLLAGLIGNAVICGALSNPNDRYQGRLSALPLIALVLLVRPGANCPLRLVSIKTILRLR